MGFLEEVEAEAWLFRKDFQGQQPWPRGHGSLSAALVVNTLP